MKTSLKYFLLELFLSSVPDHAIVSSIQPLPYTVTNISTRLLSVFYFQPPQEKKIIDKRRPKCDEPNGTLKGKTINTLKEH